MQVLRQGRTLYLMLVAIYFVELIRTAWIGDDAAITLRTVLNFVHGYGPTFNLDERVQAYTHPLWFLLISATTALLGNVFAATFLLSIVLSLAAYWLFFTRLATNALGAIVAGAALVLSKAYIDFSTSGLENPLSHLLLLLALLFALKAAEERTAGALIAFFISCAALSLNRLDLSVILLPVALLVIYLNRSTPGNLIKAIALGALPVILWTGFSLYYYGFPVPNTAYAKLGTGLPYHEVILQGGKYFLHAIDRDPLTLVFILIGVVAGLYSSPFGRALACGIVLYLLYTVNIGGDFMEGRFFTAPLLLAAVIVARSALDRAGLLAIAACVAALGLTTINTTLLSNSSYTNTTIPANGIADERGVYYQDVGLLTAQKGTFSSPEWSLGDKSVKVMCGRLGYTSIFSGPSVHFIDNCGLADPLLSHLAANYDPNWRIGHFYRNLPDGYDESIATGENRITDPEMSRYYDSIRLITRGELNSGERFSEIMKINLGEITAPVPPVNAEKQAEPLASKSPEPVEVTLEQVSKPVDGGPWDAPGNVRFEHALNIVLNTKIVITDIDISTDGNDIYQVEVEVGGKFIELGQLQSQSAEQMVRRKITLKQATPEVSRIRITALSGDGRYSLGHLILNAPPPEAAKKRTPQTQTQRKPTPQGVVQVAADRLSVPVDGGPWDAQGNTLFGQSVEIMLGGPMSISTLDLSVDNNDIYLVEIAIDGRYQPLGKIPPNPTMGMVRHRIALPQATPETDRVRITALEGDGKYSIGHFIAR